MYSIGFVANDVDGGWIGGRYYLHHLIRAVSLLPEDERIPMVDVWWDKKPPSDPFIEVRRHMSASITIRFPTSVVGRVSRVVRRSIKRTKGTSDIFRKARIGALFPSSLCESPGIPVVYWLPDLNYLHWKDALGEQEFLRWDHHFRNNIRSSDLLIVSSECSYRDLEAVCPYALEKARIVRFASLPDQTWWNLDPQAVAQSRGLDGRFFIVSNQFNHYKNHETIFDGARILRDQGFPIMIVCTGNIKGFSGDAYYKALKTFILDNNLTSHIKLLGLIPREEQIALMRRSIAILQPSRFEGWSTAVEDAKTLGKPVLASDLGVHREQLGSEHPAFISADNPEGWASAMLEVWQAALPGPHLEREAKARDQLPSRALDTGRKFVSVMREAMSAEAKPRLTAR